MKIFNKKLLNAVLLSLFLVPLFSVSCSDDDDQGSNAERKLITFAVTSPVASEGVIDDAARQVSASVPFGTDLTALKVDVSVSQGATVFPASGSVVDFSKGPVAYVVSAGGRNAAYKVSVVAQGPSKVAFVGTAENIASITEADTKAAAAWTSSTYGDDFVYLKFDAIDEEALSDVKVIFYYLDDTGIDRNSIIPSEAKDEAVVTALTGWYKTGGSFLLAGYGTQYLPTLGRITDDYAPVIYSSGTGGNNPDNWGINAGTGLTSDRTTHPIYEGLTTTEVSNPATSGSYGHDIFPLIDPGYKEDHNSMWDLNAIGALNGAPSKGVAFETNANTKILGTWQHVTDLCCAAVVEFLPTEVYEGTAIAIGPAAYEWEMNDARTNSFAGNVQKLTKNSIDYLKTK